MSNIRHPPPPPTTGGSSNSAATGASGSSSSASAVEDDRSKGGRSGREEQVYDRSPKQQRRGRQGAEKVYELLSKAKAGRQDRERERENKGGQSPAIERQTSAPGGGEGAAVYAKPKRHAPPPPGPGGVAKKGGGANIEISEGPPDYSAVMGGRDVSEIIVFEQTEVFKILSLHTV